MFGPFDKYIDQLDWPVLTLELRRNHKWTRDFGLVLMLSAIVSALSLASLIWAYCLYQGHPIYNIIDTIAAMTLIVQGALLSIYILFVGPPYAAKAISGEIETKRFDSLALTPMSSRQIVIQKAIVPMIYLAGIAVVMLPVTICCLYIMKVLTSWILLVIFGIFLSAAYSNGIAILCSALTKNTRNATAITYLILLFGPSFGLFPIQMMVMTMLMPVIAYYRYIDGQVMLLGAGILITCLITYLPYSFAVRRFESLRNSRI